MLFSQYHLTSVTFTIPGIIAGVNEFRIIMDPTFGVIAYSLHNKVKAEKHELIFDLGGCSFYASYLTIKDGIFEVKSISGDSYLGGKFLDNRMIKHFIAEFKCKCDEDISENKKAVHCLCTACECSKCTLSSNTQASTETDSLYEGICFYTSITHTQFEELNIHYSVAHQTLYTKPFRMPS